ncbi:MAG: LamG-like jellyroll fold domain-containing protein, partial [Gemmatimonadales bacterium]
ASADLPLFYNFSFSVAMWVKGGPQPDRRVFSESSRTLNAPLFNIGTQNGGATGQVDIFIRDDAGAVIVPHVLSTGTAFDDAWHHLAWVDRFGEAALYIDGVRDATDFTYPRPTAGFTIDTTTIGGILRAAPSHWFRGALDDVRIYNRALSEEEVRELAGLKPPESKFRRGDGDGNGRVEVTDAILNLAYQFLGGATPSCLKALDDDGSGRIDVSDAVYSLSYQFLGGPEQPPPGSRVCGTDPTSDDLSCDAYDACN